MSIIWPAMLTFLIGQESPDSRSLDYYEPILQKHPEMPEARFGAGYASYKKEDFVRALSEFRSALSTEDPQLKSQTFYNLGNTLYRQGKYREGLQAYRKALELNPADPDAKYNYELVRRMLKQEQSSPGQQAPQDDKNQQEPDSLQHSPQDRPSGQEGKPEERKGDRQERARPVEKEPNGNRPDAESILNALREDEANLLKRQLDVGQSRQLEKDW